MDPSTWEEATVLDSLNNFVIIYLMRLKMFDEAQSVENCTRLMRLNMFDEPQSVENCTRDIGVSEPLNPLKKWIEVYKFYHSYSLVQLSTMVELPKFPALDLLNLNTLVVEYLNKLGLGNEANAFRSNQAKDRLSLTFFPALYGWFIAFTTATASSSHEMPFLPAKDQHHFSSEGLLVDFDFRSTVGNRAFLSENSIQLEIVKRLTEGLKKRIDSICLENIQRFEKLIAERFRETEKPTLPDGNGESAATAGKSAPAATAGESAASASTSSTGKKKKKNKKPA